MVKSNLTPTVSSTLLTLSPLRCFLHFQPNKIGDPRWFIIRQSHSLRTDHSIGDIFLPVPVAFVMEDEIVYDPLFEPLAIFAVSGLDRVGVIDRHSMVLNSHV